jgi:hypothetical protein
MALAALTQCETCWRDLLASFHERYEKLMSDHPDAKKMDLVRASVVQIGQLVQNSPKMNGNGAKWKKQTEADRRTFCKFLDSQALCTGLYHMYVATYKEMRDRFQPSNMESGQENVSQADKINAERETKTLEMSAAPINRRSYLQLTKTHGRRRRITSLL